MWAQLTWFPTTGSAGSYDLPAVSWLRGNKGFISRRGTNFGPDFFSRSWTDQARAKHGVFPVEETRWNTSTHQGQSPIVVFTGDKITKTWTVALRSADHFKSKKFQDITNHRFNVEVGGIEHTLNQNSFIVATNRESQTKFAGALAVLAADPTRAFEWKTIDKITREAKWVTLDSVEMTALAMTVSAHVQASYTNERIHLEALSLLTDAQAVIDYDITTGWPDNPPSPS